MLANGIRARVNGADFTMQIHREDLQYFEARHGSSFRLYKKISAGEWQVNDVGSVLRFALAPRPSQGEDPDFYSMRAGLQERLRKMSPKRTPAERAVDPVQAAFVARGPAVYAPLAALILAACLIGVDESEAAFTDEEPADGAV